MYANKPVDRRQPPSNQLPSDSLAGEPTPNLPALEPDWPTFDRQKLGLDRGRFISNRAWIMAQWLLRAGLWPITISPYSYTRVYNPGKAPIGRDWGRIRPTLESLERVYRKHRSAGVGLKLGAEGNIVDLDVDDPEAAAAVLKRLFPAGLPKTLGWNSSRGFHLLFLWDDRLARYGRTVIKGAPDYAGLELRIGAPPGDARQLQTVVPPSLMPNGIPRSWNDARAILPLPDSVFADLDQRIEIAPPPTMSPIGGLTPPTPAKARGGWGRQSRIRRRRSLTDRAVALLSAHAPAIQGQHGSNECFNAALAVGPGFDFTFDYAFNLLNRFYNPRCVPPWSETELRKKLADAYSLARDRGWLR